MLRPSFSSSMETETEIEAAQCQCAIRNPPKKLVVVSGKNVPNYEICNPKSEIRIPKSEKS